jgi:type IV pilus assembly protein PilN
MIKINLLPVRAAKRRESIRQQFFIAIASVIFVIVCLYLVSQVQNREITRIQQDIRVTKQEIDQLKDIIAEVEELKKKKEELKEKNAVIRKLEAAKTGPVRVLEELGYAVPKTLWITSVDEKQGYMEIKGRATNNDAIADFLTNLEKSIYFKNVRLKETTAFVDKKQKMSLKKFVITTRVEYEAGI